VTGSIRSGTTWVGKMIGAHLGIRVLYEPFNWQCSECPVGHFYHYVTEETEPQFKAYLERLFQYHSPWWDKVKDNYCLEAVVRATAVAAKRLACRWLGVRPLMKDPIAFFSAEWLAKTYDMDVIVLIRHPAAFASSLKRLDWWCPTDHLLGQPQLMDGYLKPFRQELEHLDNSPDDIIEHANLYWRMVNHVALIYQRRHPDWLFLRHEDLSAHPVEEFRKVFDRLNLRFTGRVRRAIECHTAAKNPAEAPQGVIHELMRNSRENIWNWRHRLSPEEIDRIREGTADVAGHFYSEADWGPAAKCLMTNA
jgi:hypothetical protein